MLPTVTYCEVHYTISKIEGSYYEARLMNLQVHLHDQIQVAKFVVKAGGFHDDL